jgi:hypothetical protein
MRLSTNSLLFVSFISGLAFFISCSTQNSGWTSVTSIPTPADNPITDEKVALGR